MSFNGLHPVVLCETSVAIHDKRDMFGNWTLAQGSYEEISELVESPFGRRRRQSPLAESRHGGNGDFGNSVKMEVETVAVGVWTTDNECEILEDIWELKE